MKKSTLYFILPLALISILCFFPGLVGFTFFTTDFQPASPLSKFWTKVYNAKFTHEIPNNIRHLKITGDANHTFLDFKDAQKNEIKLSYPFDYAVTVNKDTLILSPNKSYYNTISISKGIESITVDMKGTVYINNLQQEKLRVIARNRSKLDFAQHYSERGKKPNNRISKVVFDVEEESILHFNSLVADSISGMVDNGMITYSTHFYCENAIVDLIGRSTVREYSDNGTSVKNLFIKGNKNYFKKSYIGKGTNLTLL